MKTNKKSGEKHYFRRLIFLHVVLAFCIIAIIPNFAFLLAFLISGHQIGDLWLWLECAVFASICGYVTNELRRYTMHEYANEKLGIQKNEKVMSLYEKAYCPVCHTLPFCNVYTGSILRRIPPSVQFICKNCGHTGKKYTDPVLALKEWYEWETG